MLSAQCPVESAQVLLVAREHQGRRLDQFLAAASGPARSRSQAARLIKAGLVMLNGTVGRASAVIRVGDRVAIAAPPRPTAPCLPQDPPVVEVLFSDSDLIVVNKPAGMTVHQAPGHTHSTLVDALLARFPDLGGMAEADGVPRPGIVHRLDKETSGVMVVARTPLARMALSRQFKERTVGKLYLAIVHQVVAQPRFVVVRAIGRHPTARKRMSVRSRHPREAVTEFLVLHHFKHPVSPVTLLRARPQTGRTHQIRVHLASSGHPCIGDVLYGGGGSASEREWRRGRQALHALALTLNHPRGGQRRQFIAPLPDDMSGFLSGRGLAVSPPMVRGWVEAE